MATRPRNAQADAETLDPRDAAGDWRVPVGAAPNGALMEHNSESEIDDDESPEDRVYAVLDQSRNAERATVKLFRVIGPGKMGWCEDFTIEQFEAGGFAMIRDRWGPGEYEIRLYALRPTDGRFGVRAKPRITIIESDTAKPAANPVPTVDPAMREMLAQMASNQAAMLQALTQRPEPPNPMENLQSMIALAGAMKQAFGIGEAPQKSSISEIVQAVRELREVSSEINPAKSADDGDSDNPMKLLPGVLDLVGKLAGGGAQPQPLPLPQFPPVALPRSVAAPNPAPSVAPVSSPVTQPPAAQQSMQETGIPNDDEMNALQMILFRGYVGKLCGMSTANDVEAAADYVLDKMPDEAIEVLENDAWFDALQQFYPPAAQHREWLTRVRDRVLAIMKEENGE